MVTEANMVCRILASSLWMALLMGAGHPAMAKTGLPDAVGTPEPDSREIRSKGDEDDEHADAGADADGKNETGGKKSKGEKKAIPLPPKRKKPKPGPEAVILSGEVVKGQVPVKSWKSLRDRQIVKQDQDYSCGAASLATLLNGFYGQKVTEEALLKAMDKGEGRASFDDMARALPKFGFRAQGFAASWEQLAQLKMPVVVYIKVRKDDHFSVLRGISGDTVWLADPSLGNRTYSREQFMDMWQTRDGKERPELAGKFLAVLPTGDRTGKQGDYFFREPLRQSRGAVQQLNFRPLP